MIVDLKRPCTDFIERTPLLMQYFAEIRLFDQLTQEQETALFKQMHNGTPLERQQARNKLIECNQRFIVAMAKKYGNNSNVADLINEGNISMIQALDNFDYTRGVHFITYAVHLIRRDMNNFLMRTNKLIRKSNISKTYHAISKATNKFIQQEERKPSTEELKDLLKEEYSVEIKDDIDLVDEQITSIDEHYMNDEDESSLGDMAEFNSVSASQNDYISSSDKLFNSALLDSMLDTLKGREAKRAKEIIKKIYGVGYATPISVDEIAEEYGITAVRVRQICNETLDYLRTHAHEMIGQLV